MPHLSQVSMLNFSGLSCSSSSKPLIFRIASSTSLPDRWTYLSGSSDLCVQPKMCLSIDSGRILARWVARECLNKWGYILLVIPAFIANVFRTLATHAGDTSLPVLFWLMLGHRKASRFDLSGWKPIQKARAGTQAITLILLGPVFPFTNA